MDAEAATGESIAAIEQDDASELTALLTRQLSSSSFLEAAAARRGTTLAAPGRRHSNSQHQSPHQVCCSACVSVVVRFPACAALVLRWEGTAA